MTERRVPDVVTEGNPFYEILIEPQKSADRSCNFGNQLHMQNTVGDVVIFNKVEHLRLINVPGIGKGVKDPIRVHCKVLPVPSVDFILFLSSDRMPA